MSINLFIEYTPIPFFIHFNCYTFVLTTYVFIFTPIYNFRPEEMNFNINTYIHKDIVQVYKLSKNSWLTWNSNNYYPELSLSLTRCNHESRSSCFAIRIFFDPSQQNRTLQRKTGIAGIKGGGIEAFNREQNKLQVDVTYSLGVWISLWSSSSFLHFLFLLYILFRCRAKYRPFATLGTTTTNRVTVQIYRVQFQEFLQSHFPFKQCSNLSSLPFLFSLVSR